MCICAHEWLLMKLYPRDDGEAGESLGKEQNDIGEISVKGRPLFRRS